MSRTAPRPTFFWYDLETSGIDPRWHRILQFAGIRTDADLVEVADPVATYVQLPIDVLPEPSACLVTGLTPQFVSRHGQPELEAHIQMNRELSVPGTCSVGFNNLRFDDEFIRYGFYRHLIDPYAREWRFGNSRWDLIDLMRAAAALRPDGLNWPVEDGRPVFRLEALSAANGVEHANVHDALADIRATLALARMLRDRQRRLYDYYLELRDKARVQHLLSVRDPVVRVHVSGMLGGDRWSLAPVMPLIRHPRNANSVIVVDLGRDIHQLLECDVDTLREALFTRGEHERPPLKEVRVNRVPFVAPISVLRPRDRLRLGIDIAVAEARFERLKKDPHVRDLVAAVYAREAPPADSDPDTALYEGFISDADRARCGEALTGLLAGQGSPAVEFEDRRLGPLLFRLRARRNAAALTPDERAEWWQQVRRKLSSGTSEVQSLEAYKLEIARLNVDGSNAVLNELHAHAAEVEGFLLGSRSLA